MVTSKNNKQPSNQRKPLRFLTCGNVDDGKSTLIGRLLWDTNAVPSDHIDDLIANPVRLGNGDTQPDFSRLLDGLEAEREQGITIDVAYRYFSTDKRTFIVADTPGHEQYTRNMFTGASTAQLAVLLIDAQTGITQQTKRHAMIATKLGIRQLILVVNKMDLVNYDQQAFKTIAKAFDKLASSLGVDAHQAIPISAVYGFNVTTQNHDVMQWYDGPSLLDCLENAEDSETTSNSFRMSVQRVTRPNEGFRGYQGTVTEGSVSKGQKIVVLPSGQEAEVLSLTNFDGELEEAHAGDAITIELNRKIDASRGDLFVGEDNKPSVDTCFASELFVLDDKPLSAKKRYWLKSMSRWIRVQIEGTHQLNLDSSEWEENTGLNSNMAVRSLLNLEEPMMFDAYKTYQSSGSFILVDPDTNATVAGGMILGPETTKKELAANVEASKLLLSMPSELAYEILQLDQISDRLAEIDIVSTQTRSAVTVSNEASRPSHG